MRLLPLKAKRVDDLEIDDLRLLASVLKIDVKVSDELLAATTAMLKGQGIDKASDLIQSPEAIQQLAGLLKPTLKQQELTRVLQCPHCTGFFFETPQRA